MTDQLQQLADQIIAHAPKEWQDALRQVYESAKGGSLTALEVAHNETTEEPKDT